MADPAQASRLFAGHFTDRTVVVTGAARGIGRAIAKAFAVCGAQAHLVDRDVGVLDAAEELCTAGLDAVAHVVDITDDAAVRALVAELDAAHERDRGIDVLINNAGVITINELENTTTEEFLRVVMVNTVAAFVMTREALPLLRRSRHACVLNASSGQGRQGFVYTPAYAASKMGIIGMSQSLAKELAPEQIRVNCYCPGIVATDMWAYNDEQWGRRLGEYAPGELMRQWIDAIPLQRPAEPDDVANLLLFLASDAATYITGQAINVDGGMFMS